MNWYYVNAGQQAGPVDDAQLEALARSGQIQDSTLVWREGMDQWQPYGSVAAPARPGGAVPAETAPIDPGAVNEAVCAECGRIFPKDETIQFGDSRVCAACKPVFMQKLAEGAKFGGGLNYARFWTRFAAVFLDGLILAVVNWGMGLAVGLTFAEASTGVQSTERLGLQFVLIGIQMVVGITYETVMIGKYGATLGKMACKVRVVMPDGGKVTYARAVGRYFAKLLSALTCSIGYIMAAFDDEKRALHDRICNTRVISVG